MFRHHGHRSLPLDPTPNNTCTEKNSGIHFEIYGWLSKMALLLRFSESKFPESISITHATCPTNLAFLGFYHPDDSHWRISIVKLIYIWPIRRQIYLFPALKFRNQDSHPRSKLTSLKCCILQFLDTYPRHGKLGNEIIPLKSLFLEVVFVVMNLCRVLGKIHDHTDQNCLCGSSLVLISVSDN